jgi:GTP cyclohydrolase I
VAYLPAAGGREARASQLEHAVDVLARRPASQQGLADRIADALAFELGAAGVAVVVAAEHLCIEMLGTGTGSAAGKTGGESFPVQTSSVRGRFRDEPALAEGVISLME